MTTKLNVKRLNLTSEIYREVLKQAPKSFITVTPVKAKKAAMKDLKKKAFKPKMSEQTKSDVSALNYRIDALEANHLSHVKAETGKVTKEDKAYCKLLRKRMLEHKFPGFKF